MSTMYAKANRVLEFLCILGVALCGAIVVVWGVKSTAPASDVPLVATGDVSAPFGNVVDLGISGGEPEPSLATRHAEIWTLSVYATRYHGRMAANGRPYDHKALTCASNNHAFGTRLHIIANGRCVMVEVTDRLDRILGKTRIDLSGAAMMSLDPNYDGTDETAGLLHGTATEVDL